MCQCQSCKLAVAQKNLVLCLELYCWSSFNVDIIYKLRADHDRAGDSMIYTISQWLAKNILGEAC